MWKPFKIEQLQSKHMSGVQCFDIFLGAAGSDPRCCAVPEKYNISTQSLLLIYFKNRGKAKDHHKKRWMETAKFQNVSIIEASSTEFSDAFEVIRDSIIQIYNQIGAYRVRVGLDITSIPKAYVAYVVGLLFKIGIAHEVIAFYAISDYRPELQNSARGQRYGRTDGEWEAVTIPYLEGNYEPSSSRLVVASVGFEGGRGRNFIAQFEPDKLITIFADPGFHPSYTKKVIEENNALLSIFDVTEPHILKVGAGDAPALCDIVDEKVSSQLSMDICYVCLGPKPHCLGLIVSALNYEAPRVVCRIPERFDEKETRSSGRYQIYRLIDLAAPI